MKFTLFASMAAVAAAQIDLDDRTVDLSTRFDAYKKKYNKEYPSEEVEAHALKAFSLNDAKIADFNGRGLTYKLGHNSFSDMTESEFNAKYIGGYKNPHDDREKNYDNSLIDLVDSAPDSIDWVEKGAVNAVKNQGQCGSCWAFSTIMGVEGDFFVEQGELVDLSEQDLVSCDHNGDQGCNGGLMDNAFKWIESNGVCTEADYPYTSASGTTGQCQTTCTPAVKITGFTDVPQENEDALLAAVAQQPVSVAIEADRSVFQLYKSGVLTSPFCGKNLDHGVGIVGYGSTTLGIKYWKVRNSWGADWGEEGYIRMERNKDMCGIAQQASYPTGATKM